MFISKRAMARRTFMKGVGVTLGLPLLDAMVPAMSAAQAVTAPVRRFGAIYLPHGMMMDQWTPREAGEAFEFSSILKPLEPFRSRTTVVSNLMGPPIVANGGHAQAPAGYLSGAAAKQTEGEDILAATTIDQVIAKQIGGGTTLPSLEVACEDFSSSLGACDTGYSCVYMNTISWAGPTTPLPMDTNPRVVFERLFGRPGSPERRRARLEQNHSILDSVSESLARMQQQLGPKDKERMDEYLENIREIERRIERAEQTAERHIPVPDAPIGPPEAFDEHAALMFDLLAVAFQADLTRVFTFMMARDVSSQAFPHIGVPDPHHALSHAANRGNDPESMSRFAKVNLHMMTMFAKFVETLQSSRDGEGTLLDHSVVLFGSGMSNGNLHSHTPLPLVIAGGGAGNVRGDRHVSAPELTPVENLHLGLAQAMGVDLQTFGRSSSPITL
jgi:hypothetical protein